jgi:antirestriction protein ArdC
VGRIGQDGLDGLQQRNPVWKEKANETDLYQLVTDQIVASLEQGVRPWMKPWNAEHAAGRITRPLRANGIAYQGINVLVLWSESVTKGYSAPIWMTFRRALELDAHVRKGERGYHGGLCSTVTRTGTDAQTGGETEQNIPFLKSYTVFNVEQIEGLPAHFHSIAAPRLDPVQRIERADALFAATKADIRRGAVMAYFGRKRWGHTGYAMEELVAELPCDRGRTLHEGSAISCRIASHRS